ncbi:hypothetical protein GWI33_012633, partial [Rhynchophorus ferrugineus]
MCPIKKRSRRPRWFKLMAVRRVQGGESKASVARSLSIPESTLRGWIKRREILCQSRGEQNSVVGIDLSLSSTAEVLEGSDFIVKKVISDILIYARVTGFQYGYLHYCNSSTVPDLDVDPFIQGFCQSIQELTTQFGPIQRIQYTGITSSIETKNFIKRWDEEQRKLTINQRQSETNTTYSQDQNQPTTSSADPQANKKFNWGSQEAQLFFLDMVRRRGHDFGVFCYDYTRTLPVIETNPFLQGFNEYKELL